MKMPNMGNSFDYFRHSSVPGVNSFKMAGVNCGLIQNRPSEPARRPESSVRSITPTHNIENNYPVLCTYLLCKLVVR